MRAAAVAVVVLCSWGCSREPYVRSAGPVPPTGVAATMKRQIENAVDAGDGDYVLRALRARLAADPANLAVRLELARHYQRAGFPELALDHYRLAADRFPDSAEARVALAKCLRSLDRRAEAAGVLEQFLETRRDAPAEAPAWLGILRDELGQFKEGELAHRAALALAPRADYLHNNLGYNLLLQGRFDEAAAAFRRALELRPDSAVARNNLGVALASRPDDAVLHWQAATDPATAHSNVAAVLIEQGQYQEARRHLEIALGYVGDHPAALHNLRLVSQFDGRPTAMPLAAEGSPFWRRFLDLLWRAISGEEQRRAPATAQENAQRAHTAPAQAPTAPRAAK